MKIVFLIPYQKMLIIRDIEIKKKKILFNFILSFPIFTEMRWNTFESKYFNFFKLEQVNHGDVIIKQNDI